MTVSDIYDILSADKDQMVWLGSVSLDDVKMMVVVVTVTCNNTTDDILIIDNVTKY